MEIVYIFSAAVTGRTGTSLAIVLLAFGTTAIGGNYLGGRLADRYGIGAAGSIGTAVLAGVLCLLVLADSNYVLAVAGFAALGAASYIVLIPRQYQLITLAPEVATVSLSWFTTAMYMGIGLAPVIGAQLVPRGGPAIALAGTVVACLALALFVLGLLLQRRLPTRTTTADATVEARESVAETPR